MRKRRLVVADTMHDGELAFPIEPLEARHRGLEADMIIELAHALRLDADARACAIIGVVAKGHDRVEPVVAAGKFNDHQDASFLRRRSRSGLGPERRAGEIAGGPKCEAAKTRA